MSEKESNIALPVDLTNPGQFFACCGLLELADRLWRGAEGWFEGEQFRIRADGGSTDAIIAALQQSVVRNTMPDAQRARLDELSSMSKKARGGRVGLEDEKRALESLRRELPIVFSGAISIRIDWFCDEYTGGSRLKTWAGRQSVLDIATAMHAGVRTSNGDPKPMLWNSARGVGLPFNFDSNLGGQGSALDIGFSFDALADGEATRIEGTCKPALELLGFIGLQRFRPRAIEGKNRFVYTAWRTSLPPSVAASAVSQAIPTGHDPAYEFQLLYRNKYYKSFLPAIPLQGDRDE